MSPLPTDAGYAHKTGLYFNNRREEMLPFVPAQAQRVLEVGCGNAAFAEYLKQERRAVHVTGIEAYTDPLGPASRRLDRLLTCSVEDALPQLRDERFDCIVLNDVLEHLVDPWQVLRNLRPALSAGGAVVASIPNMRYLPVFKDFVLAGRFQYQQEGVLDRTHLRFFTCHGMAELFSASGYEIQRLEGINPVQVSWKFSLLNALTRQSLADTRFQQFACVATARA